VTVLLTGASGFIGGHVLRALLHAGHEVRALARRPGPAIPGVTWVAGEFTRSDGPWPVEGVDAVVNCVGIIRETGRQTFQALHDAAPSSLFRAAAGRRIVQVSALGEGPEPYFRTRRVADRSAESLGGVVLRPSFVWGPGDASMRFFRSLAVFPVIVILGDGAYRVQPVHVDDLTRAVVSAVEGGPGGTFDVGGADAISFADVFDHLRRRLGLPPPRRLHLPLPLARQVARLRGPVTPEELAMLLRGSTCDLAPFVARFGFVPRGFVAGLALEPGRDAERLVAGMDALAPCLQLAVASIWLATPLVTWFAWPREASLALLAEAGIRGPLAGPILDGTCVVELALGASTLVGWRPALTGGVQLAMVLGFTAILAVTGSSLWAHPFGPITKNVLVVAATLAWMATRRGGR
jgi:uncharacterized protein YbjT (DUF2867 family)